MDNYEIKTIGVIGQYIVFDKEVNENVYKACELKLTIVHEDDTEVIKVHTIFHQGIWTQWENLANQVKSVTDVSFKMLQEHNMHQSNELTID